MINESLIFLNLFLTDWYNYTHSFLVLHISYIMFAITYRQGCTPCSFAYLKNDGKDCVVQFFTIRMYSSETKPLF